MQDGMYIEVFAVIDNVRYNAKIVDMRTVSSILANSIMDGLGKVVFLDKSTEKGGAE